MDESGGPDFIGYCCDFSDQFSDDVFGYGKIDYENDCPHYVLNEAMIKACKGNYTYQTSPGTPSD